MPAEIIENNNNSVKHATFRASQVFQDDELQSPTNNTENVLAATSGNVAPVSRPEAPEKYVKLGKIGEGTYGIVYKAVTSTKRDVVALKKVYDPKKGSGGSYLEGIPASSLREIIALKMLCHANIVGLLDIVTQENCIYIVLEYMSTDLAQVLDGLKKQSIPGLPELDVMTYAYQMLSALSYCHERRMMHRDLKPQNILVEPQKKSIKIADFGLARSFKNTIDVPITCEVVTLWYRAPEILLGCKLYTTSIDIWSTGFIIAEMISAVPLAPGDCEINQVYKIFQIFGTPAGDTSWPGVAYHPYFEMEWPNWRPKPLRELLPRATAAQIDLIKRLCRYRPGERMRARDAVKLAAFGFLQPAAAAAAGVAVGSRQKRSAAADNIVNNIGKKAKNAVVNSNSASRAVITKPLTAAGVAAAAAARRAARETGGASRRSTIAASSTSAHWPVFSQYCRPTTNNNNSTKTTTLEPVPTRNASSSAHSAHATADASSVVYSTPEYSNSSSSIHQHSQAAKHTKNIGASGSDNKNSNLANDSGLGGSAGSSKVSSCESGSSGRAGEGRKRRAAYLHSLQDDDGDDDDDIGHNDDDDDSSQPFIGTDSAYYAGKRHCTDQRRSTSGSKQQQQQQQQKHSTVIPTSSSHRSSLGGGGYAANNNNFNFERSFSSRPASRDDDNACDAALSCYPTPQLTNKRARKSMEMTERDDDVAVCSKRPHIADSMPIVNDAVINFDASMAPDDDDADFLPLLQHQKAYEAQKHQHSAMTFFGSEGAREAVRDRTHGLLQRSMSNATRWPKDMLSSSSTPAHRY